MHLTEMWKLTLVIADTGRDLEFFFLNPPTREDLYQAIRPLHWLADRWEREIKPTLDVHPWPMMQYAHKSVEQLLTRTFNSTGVDVRITVGRISIWKYDLWSNAPRHLVLYPGCEVNQGAMRRFRTAELREQAEQYLGGRTNQIVDEMTQKGIHEGKPLRELLGRYFDEFKKTLATKGST
jgi:hypothetical protein